MNNNKTPVTITPEMQERLDAMQQKRSEILTQINVYNTAVTANDANAQRKALDSLKAAEKDYTDLSMRDFSLRCLVKNSDGSVNVAQTVLNAVTGMHYSTIGHKEDKDNHKLSTTDGSKDVDLVKFCRICDIDNSWFNDVKRFNKRLALRCGHELHIPTSDLKKIDDSNCYEELLREEANGATPASNTQIAKELQDIVDKILFVPGTKNPKKNRYRVKSEDVVYLVLLYLRRSKALRVKVLTDKPLLTLMVDVMHRVVQNGHYAMDCPWVKQS